MKRYGHIIAAAVMTAGVALAQEQPPVAPPPPAPGTPAPEGREWQGRGIMRGGRMDGEGGGPEGLLLRALERPEVVAALGLSEETVQTLKAAAHEQSVAMIDLRAEMEKTALEQARLLAQPQVDEAAVMAAVEKLGALRIDAAKRQVRQVLLIKQLLTPEQLAKVREFAQRRREGADGGPRAPGGRERMEQGRERREKARRDRDNQGGDRERGDGGQAPDRRLD